MQKQRILLFGVGILDYQKKFDANVCTDIFPIRIVPQVIKNSLWVSNSTYLGNAGFLLNSPDIIKS